VTFDLGGFTHTLNQGVGYRGDEFLLGQVNDKIALTVTNGTFLVSLGTNYEFWENAGNSLIVTNRGRVLSSWLSWDGNLTVSGPGSYAHSADGWYGGTASTTIVNNAAAVYLRNGTDSSKLFLIDGGTVTNASGVFINYGASTVRIQNGGLLTGDGFTLGQQSGNTSRMIVGDPVTTSTVNEQGIRHEEYFNTTRGNTEVIVSTNGVVKIRGGAGYQLYGSAAGPADWKVQDNSIITLRGGTIQMNTNAGIAILDNNATTSLADAGTAILRGYGTISHYGGVGATNFTLYNHGVIRPGDLGLEDPTIDISTNRLGIGTINLVRGNLVQTNAAVSAQIYFQFNETGNDQINISGGLANITMGTNTFSLTAGAATPVPGVKYGLGVYNFLIATNITYTPQYDNLVNLLTNTYNLTYGVDFQYGVVNLGGGLFALQLAFVPEPSTVLLLGLGGLLVWRRAAKVGRDRRARR
jgi:hypothetical protein